MGPLNVLLCPLDLLTAQTTLAILINCPQYCLSYGFIEMMVLSHHHYTLPTTLHCILCGSRCFVPVCLKFFRQDACVLIIICQPISQLPLHFPLSPPLPIPPSPCAPAVIQGGADPGEGGHEAHQRSCPPAGDLRCPFVDGERPRPGAPQQQMESASGRVHCWVCALGLTLSPASLSSGQSR